jgi:hypothetical protein
MFVLGVLLLAGFSFLVLPAVERLPGMEPKVEALRKSGIESGAFWYTDVEKVREAERHMRHFRR